MTNENTIEKLTSMKLYGMVRAFQSTMETNAKQKYTADELLAHLVDTEFDDRKNKKLERLIKNARLRYQATLADLDFTKSRGIDKNKILRFSNSSWVTNHENIVLLGATGVGKSFLACALGNEACIAYKSVLYFNTIKLFTKLKMSKADGTYEKLLTKIERTDLLILDDFGLEALDQVTRLILFQILEDRYQKKSTVIASQIPIENWHELIKDHTIADAICDRIVHSSHMLKLKGDSLRKKYKTTNT